MARLPWLGEGATAEMVSGCLRPLFLETLARLVPEVLLALRDEVLPVYQRRSDPPAVTLLPNSPRMEMASAGNSVSSWFGEDRLPTVLRTIRYDRDPAAGRVLFTEEEAAMLSQHGHQLLSDPDAPGPERYYLWQPSRAGECRRRAGTSGRAHEKGGDDHKLGTGGPFQSAAKRFTSERC